MTGSVDLVITGDSAAARAAAVAALSRNRRVLVVLPAGDARSGRQLRNWLCRTARANAGRLSVVTSAEVVCVDGIDGVEAVVIRYTRTGRLCAVNASAFLRLSGSARRRRHPSGRRDHSR